jgi:putative Holliday junction resolvase
MQEGIARNQKEGGFLRILGLDYGEKRIGVAVCDELGFTAQGLPTIIRKTKKHDLEILENIIKNYNIEKIVIGYPVRLDGSEGIQCEKVNRFASMLEERVFLPVAKWPETLSTKEAEEILINSGVRWKKRKNKVDQLAACLILQAYLDSLASK